METVGPIDHEAVYEELAETLRRARARLLASEGPKGMVLSDFARARADAMPEGSYEDVEAYRERFVHKAAAMFACDPYGRPADVPMAYESDVLQPIREVRSLLDDRLGDATVPEKLEFFRFVSGRRTALPADSVIVAAINLLVASMVPGSDMNY